MWESIWVNAHIATMVGNGDYGIIENGAIAVAKGKIVWIGRHNDLPEHDAQTIHDVKGKWITPGLIDCHSHMVFGGSRAGEFEQRLKGASYEEIARAGGGIISTVKATREASSETLYKAAEKRLVALMKEGVTGVEIKSGYGLDLANEAKMLKVATRLSEEHNIRIQRTFLGAHALPPEYQNNPDGYIDEICAETLPTLAEMGLVDAVDAFCENIGFTAAQTERVFAKAKELSLPVKIHAEQLSDQQGAALCAKYNGLSADHLEHLTEDGIRAMARGGTAAVLLPGAFYFLRETKKPPLDLLRQYAIPIAIATDLNPGSSPAHSLLLMMNMACTLFHMTPEEALSGVTKHAAAALGWRDCGRLKKGYRADFAIWDIEQPADLAYRFGCNPCTSVVRDGVEHAV
jgi:imidazolonepropionase